MNDRAAPRCPNALRDTRRHTPAAALPELSEALERAIDTVLRSVSGHRGASRDQSRDAALAVGRGTSPRRDQQLNPCSPPPALLRTVRQVRLPDGRSLLELRVAEPLHWQCGSDPACGTWGDAAAL